MMPILPPGLAWAGLVADSLLFAASRQQQVPDDAACLIDAIIRRLWTLPEPANESQLIEAQWRLFCYRGLIGTVEHAHSLSQMSPTSRRQVLGLARQATDWPLATSYEGAMEFLEMQSALHREMSALVCGRIAAPLASHEARDPDSAPRLVNARLRPPGAGTT